MVEVDAEFPLVRSRLLRDAFAEVDPLIDAMLAASWRTQEIDVGRWSGPLSVSLAEIGTRTVGEIGPRVIAAFGAAVASSGWSVAGTRNYTLAAAEGIAGRQLTEARRFVQSRRADLEAALQRAAEIVRLAPQEMVFSLANHAAIDAGKVIGATQKRWQTNSGSSRDSHAALNGETVDIDARFSNGLRYPGSPGPPEETVNCLCSVSLIKEAA